MASGFRRFGSIWPLLTSLVATIGILIVVTFVLADLRTQMGVHSRQTAENLVHLIERDVARNIEVLDLSLRAVVEGLANPEILSSSPELRNLALFDRSATASNLGALVVFDASGMLVIDATSTTPRAIDPVTDRDYFQAQREVDRGLYISRPYRSRLIGRDVIGLSRRLSGPDGSFGGVVLATIEVSYFAGLLSELKMGRDGIVSLVRQDGEVLIRQDRYGTSTRGNVATSGIFRQMRDRERGSLTGRSVLDGIEREYAFMKVGHLPLVLSAGIGESDIYAGWGLKALMVGGAALTACAAIIGLTLGLTRQLGRRAIAEGQLQLANDELHRMSFTDALTGIGNRRSFDDALRMACSESSRTQVGFCLLLVDVDHFKKFNDRFGHPQGDRALQGVAKVLGGAAIAHGRPEMAFRIGGEEFALILTDTQRDAALKLAEAIRLTIARLPHTMSRSALTASIGIAQVVGGDTSTALSRADAALYSAKGSGRNRVVSATPAIAAA